MTKSQKKSLQYGLGAVESHHFGCPITRKDWRPFRSKRVQLVVSTAERRPRHESVTPRSGQSSRCWRALLRPFADGSQKLSDTLSSTFRPRGVAPKWVLVLRALEKDA